MSSSADPSKKRTFPVLPKKSPIDLLFNRLHLIRIDPKLIKDLIAWLKAETEEIPESELREPNVKLHYFFQFGRSLVQLAIDHWDIVHQRIRHYEQTRVEQIACLLITTNLLSRYRQQAALPTNVSEKLSQISQARGWSDVEDVIESLKEAEERLVPLGSAALIDHPEELKRFLADEDDGSFRDAFDDVRRRVDMICQYPDLFESVGIDEEEILLWENLLQDAQTFYAGREGQLQASSQTTLWRDIAFSLVLRELKKLQIVLRAAFLDHPEYFSQIEGKYWRRLDKLSRPRRPRDTPPSPPPAPSTP